MSSLPYMPLFVDAYESDTAHLSDSEHGRYFTLLRLIWKAPDCRIPNDDTWLARKLARSAEDIQKDFRPLIAEFCLTSKNFITQKRLKREWIRARDNSKRQSERAKSRWSKEKHGSRGNADVHASGTASIPKHTSKPNILNTKGNSIVLSPDLLDLFDKFWDVMPNQVRIDDARDAFAEAVVIRGHKPELILLGAKRYADEFNSLGKPKSSATWPHEWLKARAWVCRLSAMERDPEGEERKRLTKWKELGMWPKPWGAPPGMPDCTIKRDVIERFCKDFAMQSPFEQRASA